VFSEEGVKRFPPAQPEDHAIKLVPDMPGTINCKMYPLMHAEIQATKEFIKENMGLGYIKKTDSPWSSPWFFIKKKDGSLCPVQDYWEVNKWTVRDVYPIPRIEQILEALHGKELFTALDIQWGYNNIQIREEDQWKAVFKMLEGLFVTVRSPCRRSAAVKKRGSREVRYVELQSHSLQQVERGVISGNIASRGASKILRRLRITQGKDRLWNT
jgi:hypothetical protein